MVSVVPGYNDGSDHAWDAFGEFLIEEYRLQALYAPNPHHPPHIDDIINAAYTDFYEEIAWGLVYDENVNGDPEFEVTKEVYATLLDQSTTTEKESEHPVKRIIRGHVTKWFALHRIFYRDENGFHHLPISEVW